jgi:large subunit ribosomal protein L18
MTKIIDKKLRRKIRKRRSGLIKGNSERPRVVFSKSNRYLRVQAVDDAIGHTLLASSTADAEFSKENSSYSRKNKYYAKKLGKKFADELKKAGREKVVVDRNGRLYHGNFKDFCEEMRKSGINC